jgi:heat shock protein HslJ
MKVFLLAFLSACVVAGTGCTTGVSDTSAKTQSTAHTSRNSLDWAGAHEGTLPCADCPGISTRVELFLDQTYVMSMKYQDRDVAPRTSRGTFQWDAEGRSIELQDSSWRFQVREGGLALLDREGQPIAGTLAPNYVLKKVDGPSPASTASTASLTEAPTSWQLVELFGVAAGAPDASRQAPGIQFDPQAGRVSGYSGCNQFTGSYSVEAGNRLRLSQLASTRRACMGANIEPEYLRALNSVDRFEVRGGELLLKQADDAIAARFRTAASQPAR